MTLGEKLKEARKQAGLSQEQLSEKLGISRSAVAKWEADKGIPDIENLKALSGLLGVSIDYLVNNGEDLDKAVIKEAIDLSKYDGKNCYEKKGQRIFDTVLGILTDAPFGTLDVFNELKNTDKQYYLVEQDNKQFFVLVTDEFILSRKLVQKQYSEKFEIGDTKFTKCTYEVK